MRHAPISSTHVEKPVWPVPFECYRRNKTNGKFKYIRLYELTTLTDVYTIY